MSTSKLQLLSDLPIGETGSLAKDGLNFQKYAEVLGEVAINTTGPFTIGIFGEWGTGKTSLMRLIMDYLDNRDNIITVWFNAWRYEGEEHPIVPLVATITRTIEKNETFLKKLKKTGDSLLKSLRAVAYGFSAKSKVKIPGFAEIEASFVAKDMIDREEKLTADPLLDRSVYFNAFESLSNVELPASTRIVVIIDDLDRCFPDKAIGLLESIKLILSQPGFIFIIGVARRVLEGYLEYRYKQDFGIAGTEGKAYLDKIVQLPFHIPPHHTRIDELWVKVVERLDVKDKKDFKELIEILSPATGSNPRTIVRFVNNLLVDRAIYKATSGPEDITDIHISFYALSRSIQQRWPDLYSIVSLSQETCEIIAAWVSHGIPTPDKVDDVVLKDIANLLGVDRDLSNLIKSKFGKNWLQDHKRRQTTIDFLRTQRIEENQVGTKSDYKYDIFLSYDLADDEIFSLLIEALQRHRQYPPLTVWSDPLTSNIVDPRTMNNLKDTKIMVVLLSKKSVRSKTTLLHLEIAERLKMSVFPIVIEGVKFDDLPSFVLNYQLRILEKVSQQSLDKLAEEIITSMLFINRMRV